MHKFDVSKPNSTTSASIIVAIVTSDVRRAGCPRLDAARRCSPGSAGSCFRSAITSTRAIDRILSAARRLRCSKVAALEDRFHQPYRLPLVPGLGDILKLRAPGLLGCALSGAGPSILVFYERGYEAVCDLVRQIFHLHGHRAEVLVTHIAETGFEIRS